MITSVQELMNDNTIVATIKNRDSERIRSLVASCKANGITSPVLIADYGSYEKYAREYEAVCKELGLIYVRTETEGQPWSRGSALNFGISNVKTAYFTATDIDMLFDSNPYEWIFSHLREHNVFAVTSYWLPKDGNKKKAKCAGESACGGFLCIRNSTFSAIGYYDPKIKYWGMEDIDLVQRLKRTGNEPCRLPEEYKMFHRWHPNAESGFLRPDTARYDTLREYYANANAPVLMTPRNCSISKHDRPILKYVKNNILIDSRQPSSIEFSHSSIDDCFRSVELIDLCKTSSFVHIKLGKRCKKAPLSFLAKYLKKAAKPFCVLAGTEMKINVNYNFDYFYASLLPVLLEKGLTDYYMTENLEDVYLLWE